MEGFMTTQLHPFFLGRSNPIVQRPGHESWWHSVPLPDGTRTRSKQDDQETQFLMWDGMGIGDLAGKSVLDIGAADGWFSMAAAACGAERVTVIDRDYWGWPQNVSFLSEQWSLPVDVKTGDFRTSTELETYDVIFFLGVLYHVEDIFRAVQRLRDLLVDDGLLFIETQVTRIRHELPIFEAASDIFDSTAPQGLESLDQVGVANFLFPNEAAMDHLAHIYRFRNVPHFDCEYTCRYSTRRIYKFQKLADDAERWLPQRTLVPSKRSRLSRWLRLR